MCWRDQSVVTPGIGLRAMSLSDPNMTQPQVCIIGGHAYLVMNAGPVLSVTAMAMGPDWTQAKYYMIKAAKYYIIKAKY